MPSTKTPPVIDLGDFLSGEPARVQKCAQQIHYGYVSQGFFQIINHTVPRELQKQAFDFSKQFFDLPSEEKMRLDKSQNRYNRGYEAMSAQRWEGHLQPDFKEGYYVGHGLPMDHHQVTFEKFGLGPNIWPVSLGPKFRETMMEYLNQIIKLAELVMQALAISLGNDQHFFDEFCKEPMAFLKLLHYPAQPKDGAERAQAFGAHKDFGIITLLLQGDVPGLEAWDPECNDWYEVPPVERAYVVNPGNLLEQWTNDKYISNTHRVVHTADCDRYTIVFNYNGNPDHVVRCIESCREGSEVEKYAPTTVEDYIKNKYKNVYDRAGVYNLGKQTKQEVHSL